MSEALKIPVTATTPEVVFDTEKGITHTHQHFLSSRAVYVVVWNVRLGIEHSGKK